MRNADAGRRWVRGWWITLLVGVGLVGVPGLRALENRRADGQTMSALRVRVSAEEAIIARQRDEITRLAAAVDDLAQVTAGARARAAAARRIARLAAGTDEEAAARAATREPIASDAAMTLEQLARVKRNAEILADSVAVLTALLEERRIAATTAPSLWPVRGLVTSDFGLRRSPDGPGSETHPGLDIQARYGTPVAASGAGEVLFAGRDPGYGVLVILAHGRDVETFYGHLSAAYVHAGQQVHRGDVIGAVGASGRVTGPHLHFEVRVNGRPVDPQHYLARADGTGMLRVASRLTPADAPGIRAASRSPAASRLVGP